MGLMDGLLGRKKTEVIPYGDLVEGAHDVILAVHAAHGGILYANPAIEGLTGHKVDEVVGKPFADLCMPDQVLRSAELIADAWERGGAVSTGLSLRHKAQKEPIFVEISTRVTQVGGAPAIILYVRDIRERLRLTRLVAEKNEQLLESIQYARRLQVGALPPPILLSRLFPESFLLYLPRDIVSGDFYWIAETRQSYLLAIGDCTGHGVPGAMMVMLSLAFLNQALSELEEPGPAQLLTFLHRQVCAIFDTEKIRDGADIIMGSVDKSFKQLRWASANRPLWYVQAGTLHEEKGERASIGGHTPLNYEFSEKTLPLEPGMRLYFSSDGYADQFGGPEYKKLTTGRFKRLLADSAQQPIAQQSKALQDFFLRWRGDYEQMDDVLLIGIEPILSGV
jgi:PAS domain S-box-containing protein